MFSVKGRQQKMVLIPGNRVHAILFREELNITRLLLTLISGLHPLNLPNSLSTDTASLNSLILYLEAYKPTTLPEPESRVKRVYEEMTLPFKKPCRISHLLQRNF